MFTPEIKEILLKRDHLCGIIFSTLLNYNSKKKNYKVHGYYMACAIDLLQELLEILDLNKSIELTTDSKEKKYDIIIELRFIRNIMKWKRLVQIG
jgi:hypothetical protein